AGARTALATLWSVDDNSTADLMVEFYRRTTQGTVSLAEAMRQAQIELLRHPATRSPYPWAPVTLHCNWHPVPDASASQLAASSGPTELQQPPEASLEVLV